jgi:hypothetical protein
MQFARGGVLRRFRDEVYRRAPVFIPQGRKRAGVLDSDSCYLDRDATNCPLEASRHSSAHRIAVTPKASLYALGRPLWRNGCLQTKIVLSTLDAGPVRPSVTCIEAVSSLSLPQQMELIRQVRSHR